MNELNIAKSKLNLFGLNPVEWEIRKIKKHLYEIVKIDDPDFRFLGILNSSTWSKIWLTSL